MMSELVKVEILTRKDLSAFKDGVADAIVYGTRNDKETHHYYNQGFDFGIYIFAQHLANNNFFKIKREKK